MWNLKKKNKNTVKNSYELHKSDVFNVLKYFFLKKIFQDAVHAINGV